METLEPSIDARENARLLGVDYDLVMTAHRRLRRATVIVVLVLAAAIGASWSLADSVWPQLTVLAPSPLDFFAGAMTALLGAFAGLVLSTVLVAAPPLSRQTVFARQVVGAVVIAVTTLLPLWMVVVIAPMGWRGGALAAFVLFTGLLGLATADQLAIALKRQHPRLPELIAQLREFPAAQTLLDGDYRWILAMTLWGIAEAAGSALFVGGAPEAILAALAARAAVAAVVTVLIWKRGPRPALVVSAAASVVFLAAGVAVSVIA